MYELYDYVRFGCIDKFRRFLSYVSNPEGYIWVRDELINWKNSEMT